MQQFQNLQRPLSRDQVQRSTQLYMTASVHYMPMYNSAIDWFVKEAVDPALEKSALSCLERDYRRDTGTF